MRAKTHAFHTHAKLQEYIKAHATAQYEYIVDQGTCVHVFNIESGKLVKHRLGYIRSITLEVVDKAIESINS